MRGGARVAVVDRAEFPRVKLCGGWLSAPIWDALALAPRDYPGGLWEWNTCHVSVPRRGRDDPLPRLVHPPLRARRLPAAPQRRRAAPRRLGPATSRATATGSGRSPGCARATSSARAARTARSRGWSRRRARSGPVGVQEHEFQADRGGGRAHARRARRRARAAAARRSARLLVERPQDRLAERRLGHRRSAARCARPGSRRATHFLAAGHVPPRPRRARARGDEGATPTTSSIRRTSTARRAVDADGRGGRLLVRRQPGPRAAAHRRGDPAGGGLGPRLRRGDPGGRAGALPGAPGRAPADRRLPPRLPAARGGGCAGARRRARPRRRRRGAGAGARVGRASGGARWPPASRWMFSGARLPAPPHRRSRAARRRTLARPPARQRGRV